MSLTSVNVFNTWLYATLRSYIGPLLEENALLRAAEGGLSSSEYVDLCQWLTNKLKPLCGLEESLTSGPGEPRPEKLSLSIPFYIYSAQQNF